MARPSTKQLSSVEKPANRVDATCSSRFLLVGESGGDAASTLLCGAFQQSQTASSLHSQFEDRHAEIRGVDDIAYRHAACRMCLASAVRRILPRPLQKGED